MRTSVKRSNGITSVHFADYESGIDRRISTADDREDWEAIRRWSLEADRITGRA